MPLYCYECKDCKTRFEKWHSMSHEEQSCESCGSSSIFKIPSLSGPFLKEKFINNTPGRIVDQYIEDAKKEIKKEKKYLKKREL